MLRRSTPASLSWELDLLGSHPPTLINERVAPRTSPRLLISSPPSPSRFTSPHPFSSRWFISAHPLHRHSSPTHAAVNLCLNEAFLCAGSYWGGSSGPYPPPP